MRPLGKIWYALIAIFLIAMLAACYVALSAPPPEVDAKDCNCDLIEV